MNTGAEGAASEEEDHEEEEEEGSGAAELEAEEEDEEESMLEEDAGGWREVRPKGAEEGAGGDAVRPWGKRRAEVEGYRRCSSSERAGTFVRLERIREGAGTSCHWNTKEAVPKKDSQMHL